MSCPLLGTSVAFLSFPKYFWVSQALWSLKYRFVFQINKHSENNIPFIVLSLPINPQNLYKCENPENSN